MRIIDLYDNTIFSTDLHEMSEPEILLEIDGIEFEMDRQDVTDLAYLLFSWVKVCAVGEDLGLGE